MGAGSRNGVRHRVGAPPVLPEMGGGGADDDRGAAARARRRRPTCRTLHQPYAAEDQPITLQLGKKMGVTLPAVDASCWSSHRGSGAVRRSDSDGKVRS
ncbi:hypothetical protein D3C86_1864230 [compost metagenome]